MSKSLKKDQVDNLNNISKNIVKIVKENTLSTQELLKFTLEGENYLKNFGYEFDENGTLTFIGDENGWQRPPQKNHQDDEIDFEEEKN